MLFELISKVEHDTVTKTHDDILLKDPSKTIIALGINYLIFWFLEILLNRGLDCVSIKLNPSNITADVIRELGVDYLIILLNRELDYVGATVPLSIKLNPSNIIADCEIINNNFVKSSNIIADVIRDYENTFNINIRCCKWSSIVNSKLI
jgi:hypothetical protein